MSHGLSLGNIAKDGLQKCNKEVVLDSIDRFGLLQSEL